MLKLARWFSFLSTYLLIIFIFPHCDSEEEQAIEDDSDSSPPPDTSDTPERASENFIMPFETCPDESEWCFWNANGGCVPEGERFVDWGDCPTVRTQGIPWTASVNPAADSDPRLSDPDYTAELTWVTAQANAAACVCCHSSDTGSANVFDISVGPTWVSTFTNRGVMMAAGIVTSDELGAFRPEDNHGFDRYTTMFPTTDVERFRRFFLEELDHRQVSQEEIDSVRPLAGPLSGNTVSETTSCSTGVGIDAQGVFHWKGTAIRYAWVQRPDAANPGIPPNLDLPENTIWQASVHHENPAIPPGSLVYSAKPPGAEQTYPAEDAGLPTLTAGETYKLFLLPDHGQYLLENCTFVYPIDTPD